MAGVKGRSGGRRAGAGRKKVVRPEGDLEGASLNLGKLPELPETAAPKDPISAQASSLDFLKAVMNDLRQPLALRVRCAMTAAQYEHTRRKDGGKKEEQQGKADKVAGGRFAPRAAPVLKRVS